MAAATSRQDLFVSLTRNICKWWALGGGAVLFGLVAVNVVSVVMAALINKPVPGVYELVQMGAAISMFMALPYCQISGSNVTADIFTAGLERHVIVFLGGVGALFGLAWALFLLWRMSAGFEDVYEYRETTAIYQIPIWYAYVPALVSLLLFALAAIANLVQAKQGKLPEEVEAGMSS